MRTKPKIDISISKKNDELLEKQMANKSLLIDHLLSEFFKNNNTVPQRFIKINCSK